MVYDFHTHSFYSDGVLSPAELIRRAYVAGYKAIGVTDHASPANMETIIREVVKDCRLAEKFWGITAIAGVELTHVPAGYIPECASLAKHLGSKLVVVHGQTIVEPVDPGTNFAAVSCPEVDILAHPGFITEEEALLAVKNQVFLEISARAGHSLTNAHVVNIALKTGAKLIVNSDSHEPSDLLNDKFAQAVALGAGVPASQINNILEQNPILVLKKL